jgi:protoporphyrin/coproporphyrin ferrochelatase
LRFETPERAEIVFSAHGIAMSIVAKGDPYHQQIEETVRRLVERGGWPNDYRLCHQS